MLATTHVLVGASVGRVVTNPIAALVVAVGSHFVLDKITHFWPKEFKKQAVILVIEWTVATGFILFLSDNPYFLYSQFTGAIGGFLPDIILLPLIKTKAGKWHTKRQSHGQKITDALVEVSLIVVSSIILIFWR